MAYNVGVIPPFEMFFDADGGPLNAGSIYVGVADLDPIANPIDIYWDAAGLIPAAQPVRTINGYISNNGTPGNIYTAGTYSIMVRDKVGRLVYSNPSVVNVTQILSLDLASTSDVTKGDALVGVKQPFTGTVGRTQHAKNTDILSVKDWGATGDGVTDDGPAIQLALTNCPAGGCVLFPYGTYITGQQLTIPSDNIAVRGIGMPTIQAKSGSNFEQMMLATGRTNVVVESLIFDANKVGRSTGQYVRFCGLTFVDCVDSTIENCTAKNTRGYASIPGTGLAFGGNCLRCKINNCRLLNCGDVAPNASDGVYTSGTDNLISNCVALLCTDTGFVIEESNTCGIASCIADQCGAGAAITNILDTDCGGNFINGLTIKNWKGGVTGGISIGNPTAGRIGNLLNTSVSNVVMVADTTGGYGVGPAVYVRTVATGRVKGLEICNLTIDGATTQGLLVEGDDVTIIGGSIKNCQSNAIQWATGSLRGCASGVRINAALSPYAVFTVGTSDLTVQNCYINTCLTGISASDTSTIRSFNNTILNASITYEAKAVGATLERMTMLAGQPSFDGVIAGAPAGTQTKSLVVYDNTGNVAGTIPLYN